MYIGYNVTKINQMMEQMKDAYWNSAGKVEEDFESTFKANLRRLWVGPDEQDFEKRFIERLNNLLTSTYTLAINSIDTMYSLGEAWCDFQDKNTVDGSSTGQGAALRAQLSKPQVPIKAPIKFSAIEFSGSENLGLTSESSANSLRNALEFYVKSVKMAVKDLYDAVEVSNAFFGAEQTSSVKKYVDEVGLVFSTVATAVKDFDEAMYTLTNGSYTAADTTVGTDMSSASSNMSSELDLGSSKWDA